jgi:SNF family Na+-dependent transporter
MQYANKLELSLTLVGYAVGLGNIWRFPYLAYTYGGGAFLVPYLLSLALLGLPLFVLELGLGQMLRQGTLGVWKKLGLPRLQSIGVAATTCTFTVSLYYNVILAWTIYYLGRTLWAMVTTGTLPWDDEVEGFVCPETTLYHRTGTPMSVVVDSATGLYNKAYANDFWCPARAGIEPPQGFNMTIVRPAKCPAVAAVQFWERQALQQSSGMDDLGGFHPGMLLAYTLAWLLVYFCIFKGIASSGKVVYVTATLPYIALVAFFIRAVTLPNALTGIRFFVEPDFGLLFNAEVWIRASTQIFYSLGVGFGSLVAFGSYGAKSSDFVKEASKVSLINCGTSVLAGFVVFPILGYLAHELSGVNPCIHGDDLSGLASIGLSGTGLAFVAFPIAISQMSGSFFLGDIVLHHAAVFGHRFAIRDGGERHDCVG